MSTMNAGKNNSAYVPHFSKACKRDDYSVPNSDFAYSVQGCKRYFPKMITKEY